MEKGKGDDPPVDASGELSDGRAFKDAEEFKHLLREDRDQFLHAFVEHLCTYSLRRVLTVDDREVRRDGPSYSVDTLAALRGEFPSRSISLIIGMDAFLSLNKWHKWHEILQLAHIVVAHRPGWRAPDMGPMGDMLAASGTHKIEDLHSALSGHIYVHDVTQLEISSTEIRSLVAAGRNPRFLMPDAVRNIIEESGCYRASASLQDKT